jgi:hypothetical protein
MEIVLNAGIAAMLSELQQRQDVVAAPIARQIKRGGLKSRCSCRTCATCADNARWERVFNEKFADPSYYQPRVVTLGSSLARI